MTFSDLTWDSTNPKPRKRSSFRHDYLDAERTIEVPKWTEIDIPTEGKVEFFDIAIVVGYALMCVLFILATLSAVSGGGNWSFATTLGAILSVFLLIGRVLEVRWRTRNGL